MHVETEDNRFLMVRSFATVDIIEKEESSDVLTRTEDVAQTDDNEIAPPHPQGTFEN